MASKVPSLLFWDSQATKENVSQHDSPSTANVCCVDGQAPEEGESLLLTLGKELATCLKAFSCLVVVPGDCKLSIFLTKSPLSPIQGLKSRFGGLQT